MVHFASPYASTFTAYGAIETVLPEAPWHLTDFDCSTVQDAAMYFCLDIYIESTGDGLDMYKERSCC